MHLYKIWESVQKACNIRRSIKYSKRSKHYNFSQIKQNSVQVLFFSFIYIRENINLHKSKSQTIKLGIIVTHPDSWFGKLREQTYLFPGRHIRIPISQEQGLQLAKLLGREMRPLPPLTFVLLSIFIVRVIYPNYTIRRDHSSTGAQFVFHLCRCRNIWNVLKYHIL